MGADQVRTRAGAGRWLPLRQLLRPLAKALRAELSRHFEFDFLTSIERRVGQSTCLVPRGLETRLIDAMGWQ